MRELLLIWTILISLACNKAQPIEEPPVMEPSTFRYLALGDSYTIGTAIGRDSSYSALLSDSLKISSSDSVYYEVIATNGWTTGDLQNGIYTAQPDSNFDAVSILIGVNNQYQRRSIAEYRREFRVLAEAAIAFAQGDPNKVMVYSIPDWGVSPAGGNNRALIAQQIDDFNVAQREICDSLKLDFYDITTSSRGGLQDPSLIAKDGLHFSTKMHRIWMRSTYADWYQKLMLP